MAPTLQRIAIVPKYLHNQICSTGYAVLRQKVGRDHRFLYYALFTEPFMHEMKHLQKGASYPVVTDEEVKSQFIPVPPLAEQRRIVELLDGAFEAITITKANAAQNLQNARAILESHLHGVFAKTGDREQALPISKIAMHSLGKMLDKAKNRGSLQPYLRNANVRWFGFDLSDVFQMPFLPEEASKYSALRGDVLVCEGGYPGRAAIWEGTGTNLRTFRRHSIVYASTSLSTRSGLSTTCTRRTHPDG